MFKTLLLSAVFMLVAHSAGLAVPHWQKSMSPHYSTLRDGNMTAIPESYLPESYKKLTFNITRDDTATGY